MTRLLLVPAPLSQQSPTAGVMPQDLPQIHNIKTWFVETPKQARAWLKLYEHPTPIADLQLIEVNTATAAELEKAFLSAIQAGDIGMISDAGCPAIADPGAALVELAHRYDVLVHPLVGPNSIVMALMASGMNGQRFRFMGYLPVKEDERARSIVYATRESALRGETQIVIETPYRNNQLLKTLINTLEPDVMLCIASELTGPEQSIISKPVQWWKRHTPDLEKHAAIFMWLAPPAPPAAATTSKPSKFSANRPASEKPRWKNPGRK